MQHNKQTQRKQQKNIFPNKQGKNPHTKHQTETIPNANKNTHQSQQTHQQQQTTNTQQNSKQKHTNKKQTQTKQTTTTH